MPAQSPFRHGDRADFQLIETLRWEPDGGFLRLDRHLARLASSAQQLGFRLSDEAIGETLRAAAVGDGPLRVRLTLSREGHAAIVTQPFQPLPEGTVWKLAIARTRLEGTDPLVRHKTTRRDAYNTARAEYRPDEADEVLLLNQRDQVCEGTITNIFVEDDDGPFLTPILSCGLLPGVLRGELLQSGRAREAVLSSDDIISAKAVYVGNSLRGLIPTQLAR